MFDGNYAYVAVGDLGLWVYNVMNPAAPNYLTSILTGGRAAFVSYGAITIGGSPKGHIFVSNRDTPGLAAIDVSTPGTPAVSVTSAPVRRHRAAPSRRSTWTARSMSPTGRRAFASSTSRTLVSPRSCRHSRWAGSRAASWRPASTRMWRRWIPECTSSTQRTRPVPCG